MFTLPTSNASKRVDIWRKLRRQGALAWRNSGYVLPNTPTNVERFQWLAEEIRRHKGTASVAQVRGFDDLAGDELVRLFREARGREYESLRREAARVVSKADVPSAKLARFRRTLLEIAARDFFNHPGRDRVEALLAKAEGPSSPSQAARHSRRQFVGRKWVTRPRPGIDRVSSAWLIRRFLDPGARFVFAAEAAQAGDAVPFDMFGTAGFGHRGDNCTFETLRKEFAIRDPKVAVLARIVHDADLGDEKFGRPEGVGLDRVLIGWAQQGISDNGLLRRGMELIEGLYQGIAQAR